MTSLQSDPHADPALAVALDVPDAAAALELAGKLAGLPLWMKVGLELFTAEGPDLVRNLAGCGFPVFLDLKFHDIPNTVRGAVRSATRLGAAMLTVHLEGGPDMAAAALAGRDDAAAQGGRRPLLFGVTVLTSTAGHGDELSSRVVRLAGQARSWGLDGVVCSGREAAAVKAACGPDLRCLCPGIRLAGQEVDDQARVCTPHRAVREGADFLVMGRPITRAENPAHVAALALADMREAAAQERRAL